MTQARESYVMLVYGLGFRAWSFVFRVVGCWYCANYLDADFAVPFSGFIVKGFNVRSHYKEPLLFTTDP